jgi:hypothetical protein
LIHGHHFVAVRDKILSFDVFRTVHKNHLNAIGFAELQIFLEQRDGLWLHFDREMIHFLFGFLEFIGPCDQLALVAADARRFIFTAKRHFERFENRLAFAVIAHQWNIKIIRLKANELLRDFL